MYSIKYNKSVYCRILYLVAHHHRLSGVGDSQPLDGQPQHLALGRARAVERTPLDEVEVAVDGEVLRNPAGKGGGFRGGHGYPCATLAQCLKQLGDSRVELVLEDALRGEVFAGEGDGLLGPGVVHAVELAEGVFERRSDEGAERAQVGHLDAEVAQGVLHRAGDAQHGVGQRAVEVEEEVLPAHGFSRFAVTDAKIGIRGGFPKRRGLHGAMDRRRRGSVRQGPATRGSRAVSCALGPVSVELIPAGLIPVEFIPAVPVPAGHGPVGGTEGTLRK